MAMDILAYTFGVIALVAAIKCFVDENWGEKMHRESEDITAPDAHTQNIRLNSNAARTADSIHVSSMDSSEFPVRMFLVWITSPAELSTMSTSLFPASIPRLSPSNDTECAE